MPIDKFAQRAMREGYRARSAYKLLDIQRKYKIMRRGNAVLDIGAAPWSWLQVASKAVGAKGKVVGIDLKPIARVAQNVKTIVGDITKPEAEEELRAEGKFDVVLCDIAPSTTGRKEADQFASIYLSEQAFRIAKNVLRRGGNFICKVFHGKGFEEFYADVRKHFKKCRTVKPEGSRKRSREIYIVGQGFTHKI